VKSFFRHSTPSPSFPNSPHQQPSFPSFFLIVVLSSIVIAVSLVTLSQLDFKLILFLRSFHGPLVDKVGDIGNQLGHGDTLVVLSLLMAAVGWGFKHRELKLAGIQALLSHAVAGLLTQGIKHLVGRPRPRFTHLGQWDSGPTLQSGLDSFPSGHTSATFAVAAVLACHFPRLTGLWYGGALFVGISRVMRGSHFPTDVLAGAALGYVIGSLVAHPLKHWRESLIRALGAGLPWMIGAFGLLWLIFKKQEQGFFLNAMVWGGAGMVLIGWSLRLTQVIQAYRPEPDSYDIRVPASIFMMSAGLVLFTQSLTLTLLALLTAIIWWVACLSSHPGEGTTEMSSVINVGVLGISLLGFLWLMQQLKGLIPLM